MNEQLTGPTDAYGMRIGRELRSLSDRVIKPYDPVVIARSAAVGRHSRPGSLIDLTFGWLRGVRPLVLAVVVLLLALLAAVWVGVNQRPVTTLFTQGSLAFSRDGDLYVAAPDGLAITRVADGQPTSNQITKFAFSPDRRYLAFVRISDAGTGAETLGLVTPDGSTRDLYTGRGAGLTFGWAPDGTRLAVYPGAAASEIAIIDTSGRPTGALVLPDGVELMTASWSSFASLAWSPDSTWLAVAVRDGGGLSDCPTVNGNPATTGELDTCYILLATDGSGARGTSDELSNYLAWAPDSRVALTHWYTKTVEIRALDGSAPKVVVLPGTTAREHPLTATNDGHVLAWSPDGMQVLVAGYDKWTHRNTLVVIDGNGTARTVSLDDPLDGVIDPVSGMGIGITAVGWSVDGSRLLFQGAKSGSTASGIWSVDVDGGSPTLIAETTGAIFDEADGRPW